MQRFKIKVINLTVNDGKSDGPTKKPVDAMVYNQLAYHKSIPKGTCYTVTHIQTGMSLNNFRHVRQARMFIKWLDDKNNSDILDTCDKTKIGNDLYFSLAVGREIKEM